MHNRSNAITQVFAELDLLLAMSSFSWCNMLLVDLPGVLNANQREMQLCRISPAHHFNPFSPAILHDHTLIAHALLEPATGNGSVSCDPTRTRLASSDYNHAPQYCNKHNHYILHQRTSCLNTLDSNLISALPPRTCLRDRTASFCCSTIHMPAVCSSGLVSCLTN